MKPATCMVILWISLIPISVLAAGPAPAEKPSQAAKPSVATATEPTQPVILKRELQFDESDEERPVTLFAADPKLLELRYVATLRLKMVTGPLLPSNLSAIYRPEEASTQRGSGHPVYPEWNRLNDLCSFGSPARNNLIKNGLKRLAQSIPPERLPAKDIVSALTTEADPTLRQRGIEQERMPEGYTFDIAGFEIFAPTAQRAKELVRGVLTLYDYGLSYPIQQELLREKAACQRRVAELSSSRDQRKEENKVLQKQIDDFKDADISKETLNALIAQQLMLSVDVAGVRARLDACSKLLQTARLPREIESIRTSAEIELAGLQAKQETIAAIVGRAQEYNRLVAKLEREQGKIGSLNSQISRSERDFSELERSLKAAAPFPVENNKVEIRRIKWEPVKEEKAK